MQSIPEQTTPETLFEEAKKLQARYNRLPLEKDAVVIPSIVPALKTAARYFDDYTRKQILGALRYVEPAFRISGYSALSIEERGGALAISVLGYPDPIEEVFQTLQEQQGEQQLVISARGWEMIAGPDPLEQLWEAARKMGLELDTQPHSFSMIAISRLSYFEPPHPNSFKFENRSVIPFNSKEGRVGIIADAFLNSISTSQFIVTKHRPHERYQPNSLAHFFQFGAD